MDYVTRPGLTLAEADALLSELAARYAPLPPMRLALAKVNDAHPLRSMVNGPYMPPWQSSLGSLLSIPIVIDKELPEGVAEVRSGTTVRRFTLYGNALRREREATLARFLATDEDAEDAADDKPAMEPECLRTGHGPCHRCKLDRPIFRYEIGSRHRRHLGCTHSHDGDICDRCFNGAASGYDTDFIVCGGCFMTPPVCIWSEWLERCALPWLCPACWKSVTAEEIEHIKVLEAANPF